jgi:hypothetical protein
MACTVRKADDKYVADAATAMLVNTSPKRGRFTRTGRIDR